MSHIAIITACWKRPDVFGLFCAWVAQLKPKPEVVCAGSPGDACDRIARQHGLTYFQVKNDMARKWNAAVAMAQNTEATHFLFMGSDDFMDQAMWDHYQAFTGEHLGLLDLLFYHRLSGQAAYWPGYRNRRTGEPIGACKLVRRDVLEKLNWAPFNPNRPGSDEYAMHHAMLAMGIPLTTVRMERTGGLAFDVKDRASLTPWATILDQPGVKVVPDISMESQSPELWKQLRALPQR